MSPLCRLLGISRQGYYKRLSDIGMIKEEEILYTGILLYCQYLRLPENLPRSGCRELFVLCKEYFGDKFTIGRDKFYALLRANGLMLRRKKYKPRTTNSKHNLFKYKDMLNTDPKLVPKNSGELVVSDITYIECREGFVYLSLITDAYSRCIVGHCLYPTLEMEGPIRALKEAFDFYATHNIPIKEMIHHSDRGLQYASTKYTKLLKEKGCRISMTQTGDPLHNAMAERMNNTLKNSWFITYSDQSFKEAQASVKRAIEMYNEARPHQALAMRTPMQVVDNHHHNPLLNAPEFRYATER